MSQTDDDVDTITSKYFDSVKQSSSKTLNDSDDFLPKRVKKKTENSALVKKSVKTGTKKTQKKRIENNQDIKPSSNLIQFTKDFKIVCNKGGVDVDPDQLQLAIALSQSLQEQQNSPSLSDEPIREYKPCNTQEKIVKIRKTLEQFGFVVNSSEALENNFSNRNKRRKKWLPLIHKSYEEKQQIIANKVSHILLEDINFIPSRPVDKQEYKCESELLKESFCETACCVSKCFSKHEDLLKNSDVYYISNLFEQASSKVGCLLKDWSSIPGRDKSPERENITVDLKNNILFKSHFDVLLSGTFDKITSIMENLTSQPDTQTLDDDIESLDRCDSTIKNNKVSNVTCQSPDLFDDSIYDVRDKNKDSIKHNADSSDDELPYVFLNHNTIKKKLFQCNESNTRKSNCSDVILVEDEYNLEIKSEHKADQLLNNENDLTASEKKEKLLVNESAIVHYEIYHESPANISKSESPQSIHSEFYHMKDQELNSPLSTINNYDSNKDVSSKNDTCINEEIDLTQSDEECNPLSENHTGNCDFIAQENVSGNSENDDDVFILSDDELNYSVSMPSKLNKLKTEHFSNEDLQKICNSQNETFMMADDNECMSISENDCASSTLNVHRHSIDTNSSEKQSEIGFAGVENEKRLSKWYRSSIFDSIASNSISSGNTLSNGENCPIENINETFKKKIIFDKTNLSMHNTNNIIGSLQNTPNCKYVIKTKNITPMNDYKSMDSPKLVEELSKYGLKPLKRKRGNIHKSKKSFEYVCKFKYFCFSCANFRTYL